MRHLLFDLDGTLTDPREGIVGCIRHALRELGERVPEPESLLDCIGPPLADSFHHLLEDPTRQRVELAIQTYRERFGTTGLFENQLYDGIEDVVARLRGRGHRLFVATSKPRVFALRIIEHFSLSLYFDRVYGSELDGTRSAKADLIRFVLESEEIEAVSAVMVGDRSHDVEGALANGVECVGVGWGFGSVTELEAAGAKRIAQSPADLLEALADESLFESNSLRD